MRTIVCDIETEQLVNPQTVWVVVCKELETNEYTVFHPYLNGYTDLRDYLGRADCVVGHNWLGFDGPVLAKLGGITTARVVDTLVVSRLLNYNIPGGHSLEAWGERLGLPKIDFQQFDRYSKEMEEYCARDVDVTHQVYKRFLPYLGSCSIAQVRNTLRVWSNPTVDRHRGFATDEPQHL